jgi:Late exocytosis, associated with Golgi transport
MIQLHTHRHRTPPPPSKAPCGWLHPVLRLTGKEILALAGLDAYLLLRFTWMCLRICLFGTFFGMVVLVPLYYTQTGGIAKGFYQLVSTGRAIDMHLL